MSSKLTKQEYIEYIKLQLTGEILELEIEDSTIGKFVDNALIELRRYIDQSVLVTVPFAKCIDLTDFNHSAIIKIYRTEGYTGDTTVGITESTADPLYAQTWQAFTTGGNMYNLNNYLMNYISFNTLLQMRSTLSTELTFKEDKSANKLYINSAYDIPTSITIEYIPVYTDVEQITSDYWIDILKRLALAMVKVALGRIRTRFTQSNALWAQDGETLLNEGNEELKELRELLRTNSTYFYPLD